MSIADWAAEIQAGLSGWLAETHTLGAAVAFVERGQPTQVVCAGAATADTSGVELVPTTVFEAASLSKPLFAYGVLQLVHREVLALDLDAPLSSNIAEALIPDDSRAAQITARQVLAHSSGLPNWRRDKPLALQFTPGERWSYSGEGYVYLQRTVERITRMDIETLLQREVMQPLSMGSSSYVWQAAFEAQYAQGHDEAGQPVGKRKPSEANVATSLHTTAHDYAQFLAHLLEPDAASITALMLSPQVHINDTTAWALGWGLKRSSNDWIFWQWGDNTGFKHLVAGSRTQGVGLCVLTNGENGYRVWSQVLRHTLDPDNTILRWLETM